MIFRCLMTSFTHEAYVRNPKPILERAQTIKRPLFVKPASCDSSVGITKVDDYAMLERAIEVAMRYDRRIMIEEAVQSPREFRVGVLGNAENPIVPVGECIYESQFLDYETKFNDMVSYQVPGNIARSLGEQIKAMAVEIYQLLDCAGFARIDFLMDSKTGHVYFNEITSKPSFTPSSMFPRLMQAAGYNFVELCEVVVLCAIERYHYSRNEIQA
jgi:D-alanine-D-alanine ligase